MVFMSAAADPILFEAVSGPTRSLSRQGLIMFGCCAGLASAIPAVIFVAMGAWPVLGFLGVEVGLAIWLVAAHRRWSAVAEERVELRAGSLRVEQADGRGGRRAAEIDPYWARVELRGTADQPALRLVSRGKEVEIGRFLGTVEKRALAQALTAALARYRTPVFDNPMLG
jgi:uncharacterized membrane protein